MRRTPYSEIQSGVCDLLGWEESLLDADEFNKLKRNASKSLEEIWRQGWWNGLTPSERRRFAKDWFSTTDYVAGDVVYHVGSDTYYVALRASKGQEPATAAGNNSWTLNAAYWASSATKSSAGKFASNLQYQIGSLVNYAPTQLTYQAFAVPPIGTLPTDLNFWGLVPLMQPQVNYVQDGQIPIGDVLGVWRDDPRVHRGTPEVDHRLGTAGIEFFDLKVTQPWIVYLSRPHRFTGAPFDPALAYDQADPEDMTGPGIPAAGGGPPIPPISTTFPTYFGVSSLPTLTPTQIKALTLRAATTPYGVYTLTGGVADYFYWWWPATFPAPRAGDGFSINAGPLVMASFIGPFVGGPINGWYYAPATVDGRAGFLFRTYYPQGTGSPRNVLIQ